MVCQPSINAKLRSTREITFYVSKTLHEVVFERRRLTKGQEKWFVFVQNCVIEITEIAAHRNRFHKFQVFGNLLTVHFTTFIFIRSF